MQLKFGEWLSLVEHLVRDQGVGGSNPLSPTIKSHKVNELADCKFRVASGVESIWVRLAFPRPKPLGLRPLGPCECIFIE